MDVLQFLLSRLPDLILTVTNDNENLLHMALCDCNDNREIANAKVQYLCDKCPDLLYMKDCDYKTPFQFGCSSNVRDLKNLKIMHITDNSIVSERYIITFGDDEENDSDDELNLDQYLPVELWCKRHSTGGPDSDFVPTFCFLFRLCQAEMNIDRYLIVLMCNIMILIYFCVETDLHIRKF